jgi:CcmD family protein
VRLKRRLIRVKIIYRREIMETVPDTFLDLFWGYSVIWLCILGYLFSLVRRMGKVERSLSDSDK